MGQTGANLGLGSDHRQAADGTYQMQFNWQDENGTDGDAVSLTWDFCADNQGPELDLAFSK